MIISLVAAASENNVIGKDGGLPWDLPNDLKFFRNITKGHPIIMGRKTYESIGRPLPDRLNIVITRQNDFAPKYVYATHSIEEALERCKSEETKMICIIGGGEIYKQALPLSNKIYLTRVHTTIEDGDAFFPEFDSSKWKEVKCEKHSADATHQYDYTFLEYEKVKLPSRTSKNSSQTPTIGTAKPRAAISPSK